MTNGNEIDEKPENKFKSYIITSAQGIQAPYSARMYGEDSSKGKPNFSLIKNIEHYRDKNNAELQICAIPGSYINEIELDEFFHKRDDVYVEKNAKQRNEQNKKREKRKREEWRIAKKAAEEAGRVFLREFPMHYFWEEIPDTDYKTTGKRLNSNVKIIAIPEPSQNKDPLSGKQVFTQDHGGTSIVIPNPKQRFLPVASGQAGKYPKLMMTTGSCTLPNYNTTNRQGFLAERAHTPGFVVIDVIDEKIFLPRVVPAQKNGTFIDSGIKYSEENQPEKAKTIAIKFGDSHVSEMNPKVHQANIEQLKWFQPKYAHFGDVFSARSINVHELDSEIDRANKSAAGIRSLEKELVMTGEYIQENAKIAKEFGGEIYIDYSNHDDMLFRWLTKGQYKNDDENRLIAYKILGEGINRYNTLEKAIKKFVEIPENVVFLKPGEDRIYWGYQFAAHGHLGKNGARGSLKSLMEGYGKVVMGHVHQIEINSGSISVGTSSNIPLEYQLGQPSTSMAGNAVLYDGGLLQAIPIIKAHWKKEDFASYLLENTKE
ncbi:hypothetical protein CO037_01070 [Candidatus Pacearchaeota archaeon CG_4_9_14_0_2_um_filter_30_8]|nr:MAG: hypothetical protein CO037_01070 [Candidatus Pacearchaeota archaeon CG_4_9_14_0_2_um_filter_30_8]